MRRAELWHVKGCVGPMVADVDVVRRLSGPSVVSLPMGRRNCPEGRHTARLRRAVRPEIAVAIHGQRAGEHAPTPIGRRRRYALQPQNRNCCGSNLLLGNRHPSEQGARVSPYSA